MKTSKTKNRTILGIDPGTTIMGYGIIEINGKGVVLMNLGVMHLSKVEGHYQKLRKIFERIKGLIAEYQPDEMAIEAPFYGKNVQSMLKLGRAQGVAIAAGILQDIPVYEYAPKKIKQSITGNGNASKEQVAAMLQTILKFHDLPEYLDATDGLAAAVCHSFQNNKIGINGKSYSGWKNFIDANPKRITKG